MQHESRLSDGLRDLLHSRRIAALGTVGDDGLPSVSMVPYAIEPTGCSLVIHVSGLAAHTHHLQARPHVSMLVVQPEVQGEPVHALPRVTLACKATPLAPDTPAWQVCRTAYVQRFPEAAYMTQLGDFMFFALQAHGARHVAGFGAARTIDAEAVEQALGPSTRPGSPGHG